MGAVCGLSGIPRTINAPCNPIQALVEKETQKLVFRVSVGYGPKGNLILRIDGPTGVALQKGLEFSPDAVKTYRLPFQTCVPQGCSAVLRRRRRPEAGSTEIRKGTITVYALNGQAVQAPTQLAGFADGLVALEQRRAKRLTGARRAHRLDTRTPHPALDRSTARCASCSTPPSFRE